MTAGNGPILVPLGDSMVEVNAPPGWQVSVAERTTDGAPAADITPSLHGPSLTELAQGARTAVIAYTDATRACPDEKIVPPLLAQLHEAGVPQDGITLLCAIGMHRPSTHQENVAKLGKDIVERYRIVNHDPTNTVDLGEHKGVPLSVNPLCLETDILLATGVVEPHQYAGWSGGGKTVAIGCASAHTMSTSHGPQLIDDPSVRLGRIDGNIFQEAVREGARRIGLKYVANVGLGEDMQIVAAANGEPEAVHDILVEQLASLYEVAVDAPFDVVVAGVGKPKDVSLYQASRAATYIGLSSHQIVKPGGTIIMPATCPEGAGQGTGEKNFFDGISNAKDIDSYLERLRRDGLRPGEQRAFMLGSILQLYRVIVVGAQDPDIVRACHMTAAADMDEALRIAAESSNIGTSVKMLVVPHATQTLPVIDAH